MDAGLFKKLRIGPNQKIRIINQPEGIIDLFQKLPAESVLLERKSKNVDILLLFVKNIDELDKYFPKALEEIIYDGILWIAYPKQSSKMITDISRDFGWDSVFASGLRPVTQISIDTIWSALRFRPNEKVKSVRK